MKAGLVIPDELGSACSPKECSREVSEVIPEQIQHNR
jgi:hypothetical protein